MAQLGALKKTNKQKKHQNTYFLGALKIYQQEVQFSKPPWRHYCSTFLIH